MRRKSAQSVTSTTGAGHRQTDNTPPPAGPTVLHKAPPVMPSGCDWGINQLDDMPNIIHCLSGNVNAVSNGVFSISDSTRTVSFYNADGAVVSEWCVQGGSLFVALKPTVTGMQEASKVAEGMPKTFGCRIDGQGGWCVFKVLHAVERATMLELSKALAAMMLQSQTRELEASQWTYEALRKIQEGAGSSLLAKSLPVSLSMCHSEIGSAFRPAIEAFLPQDYLFKTKRHTDANSILPCNDVVKIRSVLYPGASGKGKTGAATSLPDDELRKLGGTNFKGAAVLGYYCKAAESDNHASIAAKAAGHFVGLYSKYCQHPGEFGKVLLHVVIDELGDHSQLVRDLVSQAQIEETQADSSLNAGAKMPTITTTTTTTPTTFKEVLVDSLREWYKSITGRSLAGDGVCVIVSLVGTGVGRPDEQGSLLPNYLVYQPSKDLPTRLFTQAMTSACRWNSKKMEMVTAELMNDSLFAAMLTNPRCAAFAGEEAGAALVHYELTRRIWSDSSVKVQVATLPRSACKHQVHGATQPRSVSSVKVQVGTQPRIDVNQEVQDAKGAAAYLCWHANEILTRASLKYFHSNAWQHVTQRTQLISSLVSLMLTQPHGYHLLDDSDITALCCNVGAIEDTLEWTNRAPIVSEHQVDEKALAAETKLRERALAAEAQPCIPPAKGAAAAYRYPTTGRYRYIVPPAIAAAVLLVAVTRNFMGGMFVGAQQLPSTTYENVAATVIWCALDALHRHRFRLKDAAGHAGPLRAPAVLAFPSLADHFPEVEGTEQKKETEQMQFAMWPAGVHLLVPGADEGTKTRICEVVAKVNGGKGRGGKGGPSMVLEMAGPHSPRNDLTIHNPGGLRMGFEFKSYCDSSAVWDDVLEKRCFHMGYDTINRPSPKHVHYSAGENLRGRYITLRTEALIARPGAPWPACEFLVLCGPRGQSFLGDTSCTFEDRVEGSVRKGHDTSVAELRGPDGSKCQVVGMGLGLEELLFRCAEKPQEGRNATQWAPSERCFRGRAAQKNVIKLTK